MHSAAPVQSTTEQVASPPTQSPHTVVVSQGAEVPPVTTTVPPVSTEPPDPGGYGATWQAARKTRPAAERSRVASLMAVQTVMQELSELREIDDGGKAASRLSEALRTANRNIHERTMAESDKQGMGTTASVLVAKNNFKNSSGVGVPAVTPGAGYWSAQVTHGQLSGATCGIGVNTTNPIISTAGDGEPSCYVP